MPAMTRKSSSTRENEQTIIMLTNKLLLRIGSWSCSRIAARRARDEKPGGRVKAGGQAGVPRGTRRFASLGPGHPTRQDAR